MGKKKKPIENREDFQKNENYPSTETGLPDTRFQDKVQTATAPETKTSVDLIKGNVAPNQTGVTASTAESVKKKMSIRPSSGASLTDGKQIGGVPLGETLPVRGVAGVSRANVAVDESKIPYTQGGYRPPMRYDKKNSLDNFVINNIISEQVKTEFEESKDLKEAPDALSGYNGRKQFDSARGKKNAGVAPGSLLFDRSIDFIGHGSVIHTTGQVINTIPARAGYPTTRSFDPDNIEELEHPMQKANYIPKYFTFTINRNGLITNPHFVEDKFVVDGQDTAVEASNFNWQIDANNVAQTVVKLQTELGRETTDKWSPLGYVINSPYEYNMLMHDIEATTGALVGASYKSATHSLAFNINKMGKDGAKGLSPMVEMFNGAFEDALSCDWYDNKGLNYIFNQQAFEHGSAAAMIEAFDSVNKYTTKADFFNQQRSLKFHLQNVDNNLNPLHAKEEFFKALDKEYLFSTEDGNYNPMLPIHYTDKIKLMHPLSLDYFLTGWCDPLDERNFDPATNNRDTGMARIYGYSYRDVRATYNWDVTHPFVAGLMRWMLRHRSNLARAYFRRAADDVTEITVNLPIDYGMKSPNMFNFMVCSASQDILWCRNIIFRDILFAGDQSNYIWQDLKGLNELNPLYDSQLSYVDYGSPLKLGSMATDKKIRVYFPEKIEFRLGPTETSGLNHATNKYYLPWYYNENQIGDTFYQNTGWFSSNTPNVMTMPSIRQGLNHDLVDLLYSVDEDGLRLCLDKMTEIPVFTHMDLAAHVNNDAAGNVTNGSHSYSALCGKGLVAGDTAANMNHIHFNVLRYDAMSDGRVSMTCVWDNAGCEDYRGLRDVTYYCTPREMGYIFPLIPQYSRNIIDGTGSAVQTITNVVNHFLDGSSYQKVILYRAYGQDLNAQSIDRTAALQQRWEMALAFRDPNIVYQNNLVNAHSSIIPSINAFIDGAVTIGANGAYLDPNLTVIPLEKVLNGAGNATTAGEHRVVSLQRFMFTILQRYFTPVSLFDDAYDANTETTAAAVPTATPNVDPLEGAIYFGVSGCLGSDYNQSVLERLNIKDELNLYYVNDEFIKRSLIFRG